MTSRFFYATTNSAFYDLVYIDSLTGSVQNLEDAGSSETQGINPIYLTYAPNIGLVSLAPATAFDPISGQEVFTYGVSQIQPNLITSSYTTDLLFAMTADRGNFLFHDLFPGPFGELLAVTSRGVVGEEQSLLWIDALSRSVIDLISLPDTVVVGGVTAEITWGTGFSVSGQTFVTGQYLENINISPDIAGDIVGIFRVNPNGELTFADNIAVTDPIRDVVSDGSTLYALGTAPGDFFDEFEILYQYGGVPLNQPTAIVDLSSAEPFLGAFNGPSELTPAGDPVPFPLALAESFSSYGYLASYPDLFAVFGFAATLAATHYVLAGRGEGRSVTFDGLAYVASHADLITAIGPNADAGALHYLASGRAEGRTITFDPLAYTASYDDLIGAFGDNRQQASSHYITNGFFEGRSATFDGLQYIASYGDLITAFGANKDTGTLHFLNAGFAEGRDRDLFDASQYLANYADLRAAFGADEAAATTHFTTSGFSEGRTDEPLAAAVDFVF